MSYAMSVAEREQFLAGVHVGVLSVDEGEGGRGSRAPLAAPVWYDYEPGGLVSVITARGSRKGVALAAAGRMSLCAQDENPPYRYVTVEGPVEIEDSISMSGWPWPAVTSGRRAVISTWPATPTRPART